MVIIVTVNFYPQEDKKEAFLKAFNKLAEETRKEDGCIEYTIYPKGEDADEFFLFERWESKGKLDVHSQSKHIKAFGKKTKDFFKKETEITVYEATEVK